MNPATHKEIMDRLQHYAGPGAYQEVIAINQMLQVPPIAPAIDRLARLDATIGGFGIHTLLERKLAGQQPYAINDRPLYRPIQYFQKALSEGYEWRTRNAAEMACAHIEGLVKLLAEKRNLLERLRASPLGTLLHQRGVSNALPQSVLADLCWLNDAVYVHVKHSYSMRELAEPDEVENKRKGHLFSVEEALAIYIVARYLAVGITEAMER